MNHRVASTHAGPDLDLLLAGGSVAGLGDGELLARVVVGPGPAAEAAFAALFRRHGPLVARVCRGVLGDVQLAEDAVQAVFLVLARRARSIRDPDRLASWLYGVALRTARAARRRRPLDLLPDDHPGAAPMLDPAEVLIRRERADLLLGAIARLPRRYLAPVVLCDLEGLTHAEAAAQLNCPAATVSSLIKRARGKLKSSLARHRLDFESALPPVVAAVSLPRTVQATASAQLLANCVLGTAAAVPAKAILTAALVAGLAAVAAPGEDPDPQPRSAGFAPIISSTAPQDPPSGAPAANSAVPTLPVAQDGPQPAPVPPAAVPGPRVGFPTVRDVRNYELFNGRVEASRTAEVFSNEAGVITSLGVAEGDTVRAGQVLCKLVTSANLASFENIRANLSRASQQLERIQSAARDREDAASVQAKAKVENLRESLHRLEIDGPISPFDGQVTQLTSQVGAALDAGRASLATISLVDPAMVNFMVSESSYMRVRRWLRTQPGTGHLPVRVALVDEDDFAHQGRVLFRATQFTGNPNPGPFCLLRAELPNSDRVLIPGLTARVKIDYGPSRRSLLIPWSACGSSPHIAGSDTEVRVVDDRNVVGLRSIKTTPNRNYDGFFEVEAGIDPTTRIILRDAEEFNTGDVITEGGDAPPR